MATPSSRQASRIPSISALFFTDFQRGTGDVPVTIFSAPAASATSPYRVLLTVDGSRYTLESSALNISSSTSFVPE